MRPIHRKIVYLVISLDTSKGHLKWKVSDLARLAKISRPLVYYHFGKTKRAILFRSLELIAEEYFNLAEDGKISLSEGRINESLRRTRRLYLEHPSLAVFYQKWRTQPSPLQDRLIAIEERYQDKLRRTFPHLPNSQIIALHGVLHGLMTAPFVTDEAIRETTKALRRQWDL